MSRPRLVWTVVVAVAAGALAAMFGARRVKAPRPVNSQAIGWSAADEIKQATSDAMPHEPGA